MTLIKRLAKEEKFLIILLNSDVFGYADFKTNNKKVVSPTFLHFNIQTQLDWQFW